MASAPGSSHVVGLMCRGTTHVDTLLSSCRHVVMHFSLADPEEKHGSCSVWNFRCWQEYMIYATYTKIMWNNKERRCGGGVNKRKRNESN